MEMLGYKTDQGGFDKYREKNAALFGNQIIQFSSDSQGNNPKYKYDENYNIRTPLPSAQKIKTVTPKAATILSLKKTAMTKAQPVHHLSRQPVHHLSSQTAARKGLML